MNVLWCWYRHTLFVITTVNKPVAVVGRQTPQLRMNLPAQKKIRIATLTHLTSLSGLKMKQQSRDALNLLPYQTPFTLFLPAPILTYIVKEWADVCGDEQHISVCFHDNDPNLQINSLEETPERRQMTRVKAHRRLSKGLQRLKGCAPKPRALHLQTLQHYFFIFLNQRYFTVSTSNLRAFADGGDRSLSNRDDPKSDRRSRPSSSRWAAPLSEHTRGSPCAAPG